MSKGIMKKKKMKSSTQALEAILLFFTFTLKQLESFGDSEQK